MNPAPVSSKHAPPPASPRLVRMFARYVRHYLRRHFNAVRILNGDWPALPSDQGVVFYTNHPAWWDPLVLTLLATDGFPNRRHHAAIDAAMLQKYAFFARLGFFGVASHTRQAVVDFLRTAEAVLTHPDTALWITPQGQFSDVRNRPIELRPGLAHLARRMPHVWFIPIALEYTFWTESTPEALLAFGRPVRPAKGRNDEPRAMLQQRLTDELQTAMDDLATASMRRDLSAFETLLTGRRGVGGIYDLWRRAKAMIRGRRFNPAHSDPTVERSAHEAQQ